MDHFLYLALNLATVAFPLVRSFEPKVNYKGWWPALGVGILANALFFIPLDAVFTWRGVWGFNEDYILGPTIFWLPLEEWLFFLCIPFACVFIYACMVRLVGIKDSAPWKILAWAIVAIGFATAAWHYDKTYTLIKVGSCAAFLAYHFIRTKGKGIGNLMAAFLLSIIPFFLVNGVLTSTPVVWYNDSENMGVRFSDLTGIPFLNIPLEDFYYSLLMLVITVHFMERAMANDLPLIKVFPKQKQVNSVFH